jgi:hypothetical protein
LVHRLFVPIDAEAILGIKQSRRLANDVLAWQSESSSIFSVRSAYKLGFAEFLEQCSLAASRSSDNDLCWSKIWRSSVPPKVKNFSWRAAANGLATEENKMRRGMRVTCVCNIYGTSPENAAMLWLSVHMHVVFGKK